MKNSNGPSVFRSVKLDMSRRKIPVKSSGFRAKAEADEVRYNLADPHVPWSATNSRYFSVYLAVADHSIKFEGVLPYPITDMPVGNKGGILRKFTLENGATGDGLTYECDQTLGYWRFDVWLTMANVNILNAERFVSAILEINGPVVLRPRAKRARPAASVQEKGEGGMPADEDEPMQEEADGNETEDDEERNEKANDMQEAMAKAQADQAKSRAAIDELVVLRNAVCKARAVAEADHAKAAVMVPPVGMSPDLKIAADRTRKTAAYAQAYADKVARQAGAMHQLAEDVKSVATLAIEKAMFADADKRAAAKQAEKCKAQADAAMAAFEQAAGKGARVSPEAVQQAKQSLAEAEAADAKLAEAQSRAADLLDAAKASEDRVAALMACIHRDVVARLAVEADPVPLKRQCASAPLPAPAPAPKPAPAPQPAPAPAPAPPRPAPAVKPNEPVVVDLTDD